MITKYNYLRIAFQVTFRNCPVKSDKGQHVRNYNLAQLVAEENWRHLNLDLETYCHKKCVNGYKGHLSFHIFLIFTFYGEKRGS